MKKNNFVLIILIAVLCLLALGNIHIITGANLIFPKIVMKQSFGFSEIFINVDKITGMPWISAVSRYPLGVKILQREGIIESDEEREDRIKKKFDEEWDEIMKDTQKKIEKSAESYY